MKVFRHLLAMTNSAGIIDEEYGSSGEAEQRKEPDLNDSFLQAHEKRTLLT